MKKYQKKIFLRTLTLSFLATLGLTQQSLAVSTNHSPKENCRILLSSLRIVTNEVLPSEEMSRYISLHRWARNWRGDLIPREVQIGKNLITELEDAMVNDKLTVAVNIARTMIDGAAISFRQHEQVTAAMKEVSNLQAQVESQGGTLDPSFLLNLQDKFLENFQISESNHKNNSKVTKEVLRLNQLLQDDYIITKEEVLDRLLSVYELLETYDLMLIQNIGRNFPLYELASRYLGADFEHRFDLFSVRKENPNNEAEQKTADSQSSEVTNPGYEKRKKTWEDARTFLLKEVGWSKKKGIRYPSLNQGNPEKGEIEKFYDQNILAREAHIKKSLRQELVATANRQALDLTLIVPLVEGIVKIIAKKGPGFSSFFRNMILLDERATLVQRVREIAENKDPLDLKASQLLAYAADGATGVEFLHMFAADADLTSINTWTELRNLFSSDPRFIKYKDMIEKADEAASKSGPVSIASVRMTNSKVVGLVVGVPLWAKVAPILWKAVAIYFVNNAQLSQEELEEKLKELKEELEKYKFEEELKNEKEPK
jgi:hypothetical protein